MRTKAGLTLCLTCCALIFVSFSFPVSAAKQKYTRRYQKKEAFYQKKTPYVQKRDLPDAGAYFEVSRSMPKVSVEYQPSEPSFETERNDIACHGGAALSCTRFAVGFSATTDCETSRITLKVVETQKMEIRLSSLYDKGTCQFDRILKHELSHAGIYRKTLADFIGRSEQNLAAEYVSGQKESKGCKEIQKRISDLTAGLDRQYLELAEQENAKLDLENGEHKYGFEACEKREE